MKRWSSLVFLLMFLSLQTYQVCDASEDAIEDLQSVDLILSHHRLGLQPVPAPDNDPDEAFPPVFDRTAVPTSETLTAHFVLLSQLPFLSQVALSQSTVLISPKEHSPPGFQLPPRAPFAPFNEPFVASRGSLAPPLA